jgi:membrane associated rhomboid family serine protease
MLPLRDDIPSKTFPGVTLAIIFLNVFVFLHEVRLGEGLNDFVLNWSLIPARYTDAFVASHFGLVEQIIPFFSSMFLHGGWAHLLGNMWILWIFGDNVEDRVGHFQFLLFYLLGGMAAGLLHIFTNVGSPVPTVGASGAIAAVMGAYFRFFPHARVHTIIPPFFLGPIFNLPAVFFLGGWFLLQFFNGARASRSMEGVAWWAHIGGFLFGLGAALLFFYRPRRRASNMEDHQSW